MTRVLGFATGGAAVSGRLQQPGQRRRPRAAAAELRRPAARLGQGVAVHRRRRRRRRAAPPAGRPPQRRHRYSPDRLAVDTFRLLWTLLVPELLLGSQRPLLSCPALLYPSLNAFQQALQVTPRRRSPRPFRPTDPTLFFSFLVSRLFCRPTTSPSCASTPSASSCGCSARPPFDGPPITTTARFFYFRQSLRYELPTLNGLLLDFI